MMDIHGNIRDFGVLTAMFGGRDTVLLESGLDIPKVSEYLAYITGLYFAEDRADFVSDHGEEAIGDFDMEKTKAGIAEDLEELMPSIVSGGIRDITLWARTTAGFEYDYEKWNVLCFNRE